MSPTEAEGFCKGSSNPESQLVERLLKSLSSGPRAFVIDKKLDDYQSLLKIISVSGAGGLLQVSDLGNLMVIYIDRQRLEKVCSYEECGAKSDPVEKNLCAKECGARKVNEVFQAIVRDLCETLSS